MEPTICFNWWLKLARPSSLIMKLCYLTQIWTKITWMFHNTMHVETVDNNNTELGKFNSLPW